MLAGSGLTICSNCAALVPVASGLCVLCGVTFPDETIERDVAEDSPVEVEELFDLEELICQ